MNINKAIRAHDWWGPKLSPILAIAYATLLIAHQNIMRAIPQLLFLLASLMIGAVYVSVINDITDIEEDIAAGKTNRMAKIPAHLRWLIPGGCIAAGIVFACFLYPDYLSIALYILPWVVFSMYSIAPVRLKERGIWGVFADASGAHLLPTTFTVSAISFLNQVPVNWPWFAAVAVWAFAWGLRGILWHQFHDRENDLMMGTTTYASKVVPQTFRFKAVVLLVAELLAFGVMLFIISNTLVMVFIPLYICYILLRLKLFGTGIAIIIPRNYGNNQVVMNEYYQVFLPIPLLITAALQQPYAWVLLIVHVLVFSGSFYRNFKELFTVNVLRRIVRWVKAKPLAEPFN